MGSFDDLEITGVRPDDVPPVLCQCPSKFWVLTVTIDGREIEREQFDVTKADSEQAIAEVADKHEAIVDKAIDAGLPWRVQAKCPGCGAGMQIEDGEASLLKPVAADARVLHVCVQFSEERLAVCVPGSERVSGDCGHELIVSPSVLATIKANPTMEHHKWCMECFKESNS